MTVGLQQQGDAIQHRAHNSSERNKPRLVAKKSNPFQRQQQAEETHNRSDDLEVKEKIARDRRNQCEQEQAKISDH